MSMEVCLSLSTLTSIFHSKHSSAHLLSLLRKKKKKKKKLLIILICRFCLSLIWTTFWLVPFYLPLCKYYLNCDVVRKDEEEKKIWIFRGLSVTVIQQRSIGKILPNIDKIRSLKTSLISLEKHFFSQGCQGSLWWWVSQREECNDSGSPLFLVKEKDAVWLYIPFLPWTTCHIYVLYSVIIMQENEWMWTERWRHMCLLDHTCYFYIRYRYTWTSFTYKPGFKQFP